MCCVACAVSWATWLLITSVPAWFVVLHLRCPGPLGSCSPVCPLGVLCCLCGVLGHMAPVHRCARSVRCFACAVSWATWLLFTGVPAPCIVLRVRCPGPLGSCSLVCPLGALFCLGGVLGHRAPVHRWARSVRCFACVVSWATWLLFTGAPTWFLVLRVRCPGPIGSCSPMCPLGALFCLCGVLGHLAPVHRCTCSLCCVGCAVSWSTWFLFTGVPAPCVVLLVRCLWPLGSSSPVCLIGALLCVCGVLGHLAPVHRCARCVCCVVRAVSWPFGPCSPTCSPGVLCGVLGLLAPVHWCARSVCCDVGCVCRVWLRGAHSFIWTAAIRSRQGLGTLRARTRPSGRPLFVAGRGWVPSGPKLVHPDSGCSVACRGWVRCRARTSPSGRRLVLLGTCPRAVVHCVLCALSGFAAPGGRCCLAPVRVPWLWPAACLFGVPCGPAWCAAPRPVWSLSVLRSAFPMLWCFSPDQVLAPPAVLGGCKEHTEAGQEPGSLCLPLGPTEAGALGLLCVVPVGGPAMGLSLAGPSGVGLGLRALQWFACVDPSLTRPVSRTVRRSTGTYPVHRGCVVWTPTSPLAGRRTPCLGPVRVCVCSSVLAGSGGPASRARSGAPHLFLW